MTSRESGVCKEVDMRVSADRRTLCSETEVKEKMPQLQTNVESGRQTPADLKNNFFLV